MRWPISRTVASVALVVASLGGMLVTGPATASAADGARLGIAPSDEPDYVHVELTAGGMTRRTVIVSNHSSSVQKIAIYPADGETTPQGGFAVKTMSQPRAAIGAWTDLPMPTLTLPAGGKQLVTFALKVPQQASPGDYSGGIVAQSQPQAAGTTELGHQTAVRLLTVERVVVRIYVRVAGIARPALSLGPLVSTVDHGSRSFAVTLHNTGNMRLQPTGVLRIEGRPGSPVSMDMSAIDALLPGQTTILRGAWAHPSKLFWGHATATVTSAAGTMSARASLHLVPIAIIGVALGVLLLLVVGGVWAFRFIRRARSAIRAQELVRAPPLQPV